MPRAKGGPKTRRRHKKTLKLAKGYVGGRRKTYRQARETVERGLTYAYRDRKVRRSASSARLWIIRINAAAREHGLSYSRLIAGLKAAGGRGRPQDARGARARRSAGVRRARGARRRADRRGDEAAAGATAYACAPSSRSSARRRWRRSPPSTARTTLEACGVTYLGEGLAERRSCAGLGAASGRRASRHGRARERGEGRRRRRARRARRRARGGARSRARSPGARRRHAARARAGRAATASAPRRWRTRSSTSSSRWASRSRGAGGRGRLPQLRRAQHPAGPSGARHAGHVLRRRGRATCCSARTRRRCRSASCARCEPPLRVVVPARSTGATTTRRTRRCSTRSRASGRRPRDVRGPEGRARPLPPAAVRRQTRAVRFRPSFFPFTEPSARGRHRLHPLRRDGPRRRSGCRVCKGTGWLEILGSRDGPPDVLRAVGYDPEEVQRLRVRHGHRAHRCSCARHRRHPAVLRQRRALPRGSSDAMRDPARVAARARRRSIWRPTCSPTADDGGSARRHRGGRPRRSARRRRPADRGRAAPAGRSACRLPRRRRQRASSSCRARPNCAPAGACRWRWSAPRSPNGTRIAAVEIRGVRSEGMLCSEAELGLGRRRLLVLELPADAAVGTALADAARRRRHGARARRDAEPRRLPLAPRRRARDRGAHRRARSAMPRVRLREHGAPASGERDASRSSRATAAASTARASCAA